MVRRPPTSNRSVTHLPDTLLFRSLQKAVELVVTRIEPLLSSRSDVRLDAERMDKKLEHWRGVIVSACEQSGRTLIPSLNEPAALLTWLDQSPTDGMRLTLDPLAACGLRGLARERKSTRLNSSH